jgi:hypothetical protein
MQSSAAEMPPIHYLDINHQQQHFSYRHQIAQASSRFQF